MSRIECKWENPFVLPQQHSIRLMWSAAFDPGLRPWTNGICLATKHHQILPEYCLVTKHANVEVSGQTIKKHVWSNICQSIDTSRWASVVRMLPSNIFDTQLFRRTKRRPSNTRTKEMYYLFDRMFDGLRILTNTIKQQQKRCPNCKIFRVTKQCLMLFGRQTFPVCPGPYAII